MKNIRITLLAVALLFAANAAKAQKYKIAGEIKGLDVNVGYIVIEDANAPRGYRIDSLEFKGGKFEYTAKVDAPEVLRISFRSEKLMKMVGRGYIPTKSALLHFIAYPGADIKIKGEATDYCGAYPFGDVENETLTMLHKEIYPFAN